MTPELIVLLALAFTALLLAAARVGYGLAQRKAAPKQNVDDFRLIFDASPAFIFFKDCHNRILRVNRTAAAAIGKSPAEMEGRATEEFYPEEAAAYFADDLDVIRSGSPKIGIVEPLLLQDGSKIWVRTDKVPHRNERGDIIGVIVFALDITKQKEVEVKLKGALEAAELAVKDKTAFVATLCHQLRTPLGVLMGFAELSMGESESDAQRQAHAERIFRNAEKLRGIIEEARVQTIESIQTQKPPPGQPSPAHTLGNGPHVLLVEDNTDIQDMISLFLAGTNMKLTLASTGDAGVAKALQESPDMILMDLQLPGLDGTSALRQLRHAGFTRPIVALTAHAMAGQEEQCLMQGFSAYLSKPMTRSALLSIIGRHCPSASV